MTAITVAAVIAFIIDRASKLIIVKNVFDMPSPLTDKFGTSIPIIKDVFNITYQGNTGMAFSLLAGNRALLITICCVILTAIIFLCLKYKPRSMLQKISIGMIIGGAIGNVLDRILYGFVIDFLDFCLINYPVFNVADCSIVIGAVLFCIHIIFFDKKEDCIGNE